MKVAKIIIFTNGNVMAFDMRGEQFSKCQGFVFSKRVENGIRKYCDENTAFEFGNWNEGTRMNAKFSWWFKEKEKLNVKQI